MKILVFEYITGGGYNHSELPLSLAREGLLMLNALVNDLIELDTIDVVAMLDDRLLDQVTIPPNQLKLIHREHDCLDEFSRLLQQCDAAWPIAPESGGILQKLCEAVESAGRILLNSSSTAVALAGNKWLTFKHLQQHVIPAVATELLAEFNDKEGEWIIKPVDGVGCEGSYVLSSYNEYNHYTQGLDKARYIIQPHLNGQKPSLSALFKQGKGWLVSVNLQYFDLTNSQYHLAGIDVNFKSPAFKYKLIVENIAKSIPGLWGYVGIDLIESGDELLVLEINPRLTSSYAGIFTASGINCAEAILELLHGEPTLTPSLNQIASLRLSGEINYDG